MGLPARFLKPSGAVVLFCFVATQHTPVRTALHVDVLMAHSKKHSVVYCHEQTCSRLPSPTHLNLPLSSSLPDIITTRYLSSVEHSHTTSVCDLCWLPGMEVDRSGKVFAIRANSAGTSAQVCM